MHVLVELNNLHFRWGLDLLMVGHQNLDGDGDGEEGVYEEEGEERQG